MQTKHSDLLKALTPGGNLVSFNAVPGRRKKLPLNPVMLLLVFLGVLTVLPRIASADDQLWSTFKTEKNLVVLMRHMHARGGNPLTWDETGNCDGESELTNRGRAHARRVGEAFKAHVIKIGAILSSPMCRCRQTVEEAFGGEFFTDPVLREIASANDDGRRLFEERARKLIAKYRGDAPVVFVSHRPNIDLLAVELIKIEEMLVAKSDENGELEIVGKLNIEEP